MEVLLFILLLSVIIMVLLLYFSMISSLLDTKNIHNAFDYAEAVLKQINSWMKKFTIFGKIIISPFIIIYLILQVLSLAIGISVNLVCDIFIWFKKLILK